QTVLLVWRCLMRLVLAVCLFGGAVLAQDVEKWEKEMIEANRLTRLGQYPEAEKLYLEQARIAESFEPGDIRLAKVWNNLGALYHQMGRFADAERLYRKALPTYEALQGAARVAYASVLNNLAEIERIRGRYNEAESLYKNAIRVRELVNPTDPDL